MAPQRSRARLLTDLAAPRGLVEQRPDRLAQRGSVARSHEHTVAPVADKIMQAAHI